MTPVAFLDTNVILRHLLSDHEQHSLVARDLFRRIAREELSVAISETVIFEAAYTLEKQYRATRAEIRRSLEAVLNLPGIEMDGKSSYTDVFALWEREQSLSFADCAHLVATRRLGLDRIVSFDRKIDRRTDIRRVEPDEL